MTLFLKTYETELKDSTAIRKLSGVDPEEIIRRGDTDFSTRHAALRYVRILRKKYNTHPGRRLGYRFNE